MKAQERVAKAVEERGYRDGWTREQFLVRQIAKLTEELAELSEVMHAQRYYRRDWEVYLWHAGKGAREHFDRVDLWDTYKIVSEDQAREEIADLQVIVFNLADALDFDVMEAAVAKAETDVEHGVGATRE